jgi:hypothetical protein
MATLNVGHIISVQREMQKVEYNSEEGTGLVRLEGKY